MLSLILNLILSSISFSETNPLVMKKELVIYYTNSWRKQSVEGRGGLGLALAKIKDLEHKYPHHILVNANKRAPSKDYRAFITDMKILNFVGNKAMVATDEYLSNPLIERVAKDRIPMLALNVNRPNSITKSPFSYVTLYEHGLRIAILGVMEEREINSNQFQIEGIPKQETDWEFKNYLRELQFNIDLLKTNFAPHILIILTDVQKLDEITKIAEDNNAVLISPYEVKRARNIVSIPVDENSLGMIRLDIFDNELKNGEASVIALSSDSGSYSNKEIKNKIATLKEKIKLESNQETKVKLEEELKALISQLEDINRAVKEIKIEL